MLIKNKIYYIHIKQGFPMFIKILKVNKDNTISYVMSSFKNLKKRKNSYTFKCYVERHSRKIFVLDENLNKNLKDFSNYEIMDSYINRDLTEFKTIQEEIDSEFNGNIELWMRYHRLEMEYKNIHNYKSFFNISLSIFENAIVIPEELFNNYDIFRYKDKKDYVPKRLSNNELVKYKKEKRERIINDLVL